MATDANGQELGVIFETTSPFDTPLEMEQLVSWTQTAFAEGRLHPLLIIAVFVVRFLAIHPFQDGNGRLSRALATYLLLKTGYRYVPYSSMEAVIEQEKSAYYLALRQTQTTLRLPKTNWEPWVVFFLRSLKRQKDNLETKVNREHILLNQQPEHAHAILDLLRSRGRITVGELEKLTTYSRHNLKKSLEKLVKTGQIRQNGMGKGTWYTMV